MTEAIARKIKRLERGEAPRVLDLFSGCGGLSLGFQAAGFQIDAAVEMDPAAARTHAANFHPTPPELRERHEQTRDITSISPAQLAAELDLGPAEIAFDVVVGGPPCQAFSRIGREKLRTVFKDPAAYLNDPRRDLYINFLHYVEVVHPLAVLVENVPEFLNFKEPGAPAGSYGKNIAQEMSDVLEDMGYVSGYTLLNAVHYGVPQLRERVFLLAFRRELTSKVEFPAPSHAYERPAGYRGIRSHLSADSQLDFLDPQRFRSFLRSPGFVGRPPRGVSSRDALDDLPRLTPHLCANGISDEAHDLRAFHAYPEARGLNAFAREMRSWPGFESKDGVFQHACRRLPRDYPIFERMEPGDTYVKAHQIALRLFEEKQRSLFGRSGATSEAELEELRAETVPPYDPGKFASKWRKIEPDQPARTLMAHLGKDSYTHVHYDSAQARTITVREAARLQSFPDGFTFVGGMNAAFRQIGNAVPPLLARALAKQVRRALIR